MGSEDSWLQRADCVILPPIRVYYRINLGNKCRQANAAALETIEWPVAALQSAEYTQITLSASPRTPWYNAVASFVDLGRKRWQVLRGEYLPNAKAERT